MKIGSFLLMTYLLLLMAIPLHAKEECSHHEHEQHEVPAEETHCCPPFSFCKSCSHFIFEKYYPIQLELLMDAIANSEVEPKQKSYLSVEVPFWHPPKLS